MTLFLSPQVKLALNEGDFMISAILKNICRLHLQRCAWRMLANTFDSGTFAGLIVSSCGGTALMGTAWNSW